jgi:DNA modification methylase
MRDSDDKRPVTRLFKEPQGDLFEKSVEETIAEPVDCLGQTFESDEARREHYLALLAEKLKDPEFRKTPGFPKGTDDAILRLSDPPYYTACPNPFLEEFVRVHGRQYDPKEPYDREPFAADVSEGKYNPIYRMHPYHTKVPHKAIMRYILHYTEPGDIVFDGVCGTGMTGVAAYMCGEREQVCALGYQVDQDGVVFREASGPKEKLSWEPFSKLGLRRAILNDLSPAATFISRQYNSVKDVAGFERQCNQILAEVEKECEWMFETTHSDGSQNGRIDYVVWSDVFICPECGVDIVFWEDAVDIPAGKVLKDFACSACQTRLTKRSLGRKKTIQFDKALNQSRKFSEQVPVLISYTVGGNRYSKVPDSSDLALIHKVATTDIAYWHPIKELPPGVNTSQPISSHGFNHLHDFYTRRNLAVLSSFCSRATVNEMSVLTTVALRITKRYGLTYQSGVWGAGGGPTNGTYYIPALSKELNMIKMLRAALKKLVNGIREASVSDYSSVISTQSLDGLVCDDNSIDYAFIDPPFGANLNYSELNFIWESWLGVVTENENEAIENKVQKKGSEEYRSLMTHCFEQVYRVLKPGRWLTVEFSNTSAQVWNNIQAALLESGFIVANVSALDKQKGSFKALTTPTAVKQDLIISAYKPRGALEQSFQAATLAPESVWDFVRSHLAFLPVVKEQAKNLVPIPERDPRILFDRLVAYFVRKGHLVPISSGEFQLGLSSRFPDRDGMIFLPEQVLTYDRKRTTASVLRQLEFFVTDEASSIQWARQRLQAKPQSFQDLQPQFMQQLQSWEKHEKTIELKEILELNFFCYDGAGPVPSQIHSYLSTNFKDLRNLGNDDASLKAKAIDCWYVPNPNKEGDLEMLRLRTLLKEFEEYRTTTSRKIKQFRSEAVRAGFKHCYDQGDYQTIVAVAEKLPEKVIQGDEKLLMYYDVATMRLGSE